MELLTADGWSPANSVESVIHQIRAMLIQGSAVVDGGATTRLGDTSEWQARREFQQIVDTHKRSGWSSMKAWRS
jgi:ubiquitin-protein ligase